MTSKRSADTVFQRSFEVPYAFETISERGSLKLTSVLATTAPRHFDLWFDEIGGPDFFETTGVFVPVVAFDFYVSDHPIALGEPFQIDITIRLGRQVGDDGAIRRLLSESLGEVYSTHAETGTRVLLARCLKHNVLSRNDADPAKRRVTEFPSSMKIGGTPERLLSFPSVAEMLRAPDGYSEAARFADSEPHYWSYQQTDMNQHINAMEYVRVLEHFVIDKIAKSGESPRDFLIERARLAYRKPCFSGETFHRQGRYLSAPGEPPTLVCAGLHKGDSTDSEPVVATQMYLRRRPT